MKRPNIEVANFDLKRGMRWFLGRILDANVWMPDQVRHDNIVVGMILK